MGLIGKAQDKIVKRIEKAQTCKKCGCGPRKWCDNCTARDCDCAPGNR